jgi:hypothetical protein
LVFGKGKKGVKFLIFVGNRGFLVGFGLVFSVFCRKLLDFRCFLQVICDAGGQHEVPYRQVDMSRRDI